MSRKIIASLGSAAVVVAAAGAYVAADAMSASATVRPAATCKASTPNQGTLTGTGLFKESVTSLSNPITEVPASGGGAGAGSVGLGPVTITTAVDANTSKFLSTLAAGRALPTVTVTLGCNGVTEYTYVFSDGLVDGVTTSWHGGAQSATILLKYGKISETPRGGTTFCWDALTNSAC